MADIASKMTLARWLRAETEVYLDLSDDFLYAKMLKRGIADDELTYADAPARERDLILADILWAAATSSQKSGTQGETDGGWTHYVAIKNVADRDGLKVMAKALYDEWNEEAPAEKKITWKSIY